MKLFVFRPDRYGINTYMVMARNVEDAKSAVKKYCEENENCVDHTEFGFIESKDDSGEDLYKIEVYDEGQVTDNEND